MRKSGLSPRKVYHFVTKYERSVYEKARPEREREKIGQPISSLTVEEEKNVSVDAASQNLYQL